MKKKSMTTFQLAGIALMTAFLCILGPITVATPLSPVPISLATFAIGLSGILLGKRAGFLSCVLYLFMGCVGLPVFSGFRGGIGTLLGPTGGYLVGYLFLAAVSGSFAEHFMGSRFRDKIGLASGLLLGNGLLYVVGTLWLAYTAQMSYGAALAAGVLPFLPGDVLKCLLAVWLGPQIRIRSQLRLENER